IAINNQLFPKQPVRPYSLSTPFQFNKNEETYSSTNYPEKANGVLTTNFYRGHAIANVCFTPVVYNPAENQVSFYSTVTVKVSYETSEKATNALRFLKKTDNIEKKVQNTEMINKYENLISESKSDDYDVLILSSAIFETAFEELRVLHTNYGLISKFKDLSEIYSEMDGSDNPEKIRNYIIQEYENHSIEYVLLGGDVEILPYRGFYCHVQSSSPYIDNDIPSDLYYSALDGNWNDNNNSLWGEIGEDDLEPEVSVSRMSFSNLNELNAMIHKTVSYQTDPVLGELNKPLLLGEHLYYGPLTWGADYLDLLVGEHNDNGYYTKGIPETDPYDSLYDRGAASQWTSTQLINRMNEGASFIYHAGHSDWNYMMRLSNYHITTTNFPKLDGITHNYTFVYSHGCICGAFDENDCIAEKMTTNQNILVGGVFNSRYGWFNEGQTEGPSGHLNREFVDALYTDEYNRLGRAHKESKIATSPWVNAPGQWEEGALRWCFYCSNALGDPALAIWRDEPYNVEVSCLMEFDPDATSFDVTVTINNEAASGTSCVMMNGDEFLGRAVTDETGFCVIEFIKELPNVENIQLYVNNYNTLLTKTVITFPNWVGINNHSNNESLNVYPNPADNSIFVEISEKDNENLMIEILNISGQVVITQKIKSQNIIDISSLSSGAYFVRYGDSTTKFVKK
ncbi:C25 family cysteine peptidase, partial [Bacteroidales bacterium OttesenSCG-928-K03]|nr:C25 family cysteine peptidase [Bacteroidales bacterium OttesenSCG-928-K03]